MVQIRRNDPRDLSAFAALNLAWIQDMHEVESSDLRMYESPEIYMQGDNSVFAAIVADKTVGVGALKQDEQGSWELTKMAVDPAFRGRGIGGKLMHAIESYAKTEMGLSQIYLLSSTKNEAAIRLYERHGWVVNHRGPYPQYARCNIGMRKTL